MKGSWSEYTTEYLRQHCAFIEAQVAYWAMVASCHYGDDYEMYQACLRIAATHRLEVREIEAELDKRDSES